MEKPKRELCLETDEGISGRTESSINAVKCRVECTASRLTKNVASYKVIWMTEQFTVT